MSRSLKIIQTVMKVLRVIVKIGFVCCIVGGVLSLASGVFALLANAGVSTFFDITVDSKTIEVIILEETGMNKVVLAANCLFGSILCVGGAINCKLHAIYLDKEINDGQPFTFDGADLLMKTAIRSIIVSIVSGIIAAIAFAIVAFGNGDATADFDWSISLFDPIALLLISVIFKYGAEIKANNNNNNF
ncbi:MAG: hypothetical protein MJZ37_03650 [Bacilli bacterium]|nr:hypothetical protein [Bacilli bacterium]